MTSAWLYSVLYRTYALPTHIHDSTHNVHVSTCSSQRCYHNARERRKNARKKISSRGLPNVVCAGV